MCHLKLKEEAMGEIEQFQLLSRFLYRGSCFFMFGLLHFDVVDFSNGHCGLIHRCIDGG